jgi:hypothetical protein
MSFLGSDRPRKRRTKGKRTDASRTTGGDDPEEDGGGYSVNALLGSAGIREVTTG